MVRLCDCGEASDQSAISDDRDGGRRVRDVEESVVVEIAEVLVLGVAV
jgi:hypothetical protein